MWYGHPSLWTDGSHVSPFHSFASPHLISPHPYLLISIWHDITWRMMMIDWWWWCQWVIERGGNDFLRFNLTTMVNTTTTNTTTFTNTTTITTTLVNRSSSTRVVRITWSSRVSVYWISWIRTSTHLLWEWENGGWWVVGGGDVVSWWWYDGCSMRWKATMILVLSGGWWWMVIDDSFICRYCWHFPELRDLVKDNYVFAR